MLAAHEPHGVRTSRTRARGASREEALLLLLLWLPDHPGRIHRVGKLPSSQNHEFSDPYRLELGERRRRLERRLATDHLESILLGACFAAALPGGDGNKITLAGDGPMPCYRAVALWLRGDQIGMAVLTTVKHVRQAAAPPSHDEG